MEVYWLLKYWLIAKFWLLLKPGLFINFHFFLLGRYSKDAISEGTFIGF